VADREPAGARSFAAEQGSGPNGAAIGSRMGNS